MRRGSYTLCHSLCILYLPGLSSMNHVIYLKYIVVKNVTLAVTVLQELDRILDGTWESRLITIIGIQLWILSRLLLVWISLFSVIMLSHALLCSYLIWLMIKWCHFLENNFCCFTLTSGLLQLLILTLGCLLNCYQELLWFILTLLTLCNVIRRQLYIRIMVFRYR